MSNISSVVLAHLEACERCRVRPFDPCPIGATLLPSVEEASLRAVRHRLGVDGRLGAVEDVDTGETERGYGHGV